MKINPRIWFFSATVAYLIVLFIATPKELSWWYVVAFFCFSLFVFFIAPQALREKMKMDDALWRTIATIAILLLIASRVVAFVHWGEAPFGYDTGIYLETFRQYQSSTDANPLWLIARLSYWIGLSPEQSMTIAYAFWNMLLAGGVYLAVKSLFGKRIYAVAALFIFSVSIAQYEAYAWMFYRMMISFVFAMGTIALLGRRSWLAAITGSMAGVIHPAGFMLFAFGYLLTFFGSCIQWARSRSTVWKTTTVYLFVVGMVMLAISLTVNPVEYRGMIHFITDEKLQLDAVDQYLSQELSGAYLNYSGFIVSILLYLPFVLVGYWWLIRTYKTWRSQPSSLALLCAGVMLLVTFFYIGGEFIFFRRFLLFLDLLLLIPASVALGSFMNYFSTEWVGKTFLLFLLAGFSLLSLTYAWTRPPHIPPEELQEMKRVSMMMEDEAYAMATNTYYTPWVYGYLSRKAIAPGYFLNIWSTDEWGRFWHTGTDTQREALLREYGDEPIYLFIGSRQEAYPALEDFLSEHAQQVGLFIWKYQP